MKPVSRAQIAIARKLDVPIDQDSFAVAAAQIENALTPVLLGENEEVRPASERQIEFAKSLGVDVTKDSMNVASVPNSGAT